MPIGTSFQQLEKESKNFSTTEAIKPSSFKLNDPQQYRFIAFIGKVRAVWYPTLQQNQEGVYVTSWNKLIKPPNGVKTILDRLYASEVAAIQRTFATDDIKKFNCQFSPNEKFWFTCFDRKEKKPVVKIMEAGFTIFNYLREQSKLILPSNQQFLANGPFWFWDTIITAVAKDSQKNLPEAFKRAYSCTIYANKWEGKVREELMNETSKEHSKVCDLDELKKVGVFTNEEVEAIIKFDKEVDILSMIKPNTPEEIEEEILDKNPILITALKQGGIPVFPYAKFLAEEFEKRSITYDSTVISPSTYGNTGVKEISYVPSSVVTAEKESKGKQIDIDDLPEVPSLSSTKRIEVATETTNDFNKGIF